MGSYKDITTFSTPMLVKSLDTLQISAGEDNGEWGAEFPQGVAIFVPGGEYLEVVLLQLGAGAKKAPFLLCDQRYVPVLSGRLEYPANNHCIRIRVTIGKHRALPLPQ